MSWAISIAHFSGRCDRLVGRVGQVSENLQIGHQRVHLGQFVRTVIERAHVRCLAVTFDYTWRTRANPASSLPISIGCGIGDHVVGIGHPDGALRLEMKAEIIGSQRRPNSQL